MPDELGSDSFLAATLMLNTNDASQQGFLVRDTADSGRCLRQEWSGARCGDMLLELSDREADVRRYCSARLRSSLRCRSLHSLRVRCIDASLSTRRWSI
jgi:hypothetical protein